MITVQNLEFTYRGAPFRLDVPELRIEEGAKVAVIGPSGSGKTTLLNLIAGILTPQRGAIEVADTPLSRQSDAARRSFRIANVGFVFQDFELIEYLTVLDNILHPYRINRTHGLTNDVRDRARRLADAVGLSDKLRRYPRRLSQGERQRAALCRALITEPKLLLADEPTGNLDPSSKGAILDLLFEQAEAGGATLIMVTHDHSLLDGFDRVIDFATLRKDTAHAG
jgi:putative ABC transport system ATP-binding protein